MVRRRLTSVFVGDLVRAETCVSVRRWRYQPCDAVSIREETDVSLRLAGKGGELVMCGSTTLYGR